MKVKKDGKTIIVDDKVGEILIKRHGYEKIKVKKES